MTASPVPGPPPAGLPRYSWRDAGAVLAVGAFLQFTNPFGATGGLPIWGGFLYWTLLVGMGWLGGPLIGALLSRFVPALPFGLNRVLATAVVAIAVTGAIIAIQAALGAPVASWYWPTLYGLVFGVSVAIAAVAWLVDRAFAGPPGVATHAPPTGSAPSAPRFLERLPPKLKGALLYAVQAEDHYLRLHTSKGSDLILLRLTDAIAELDGVEGAQTHRSWWVAKDAVESARREGDRVTLVLKGGAEAPVSRPNIRPLREAGWF